MKVSNLFTKTLREAPKDAEDKATAYLLRGGFVERLAAGVYTFLPLGFRVLKKIEQLIREEMEALGGEELLMPALHPKENWEKTGRWDSMDEILYKTKARSGDFCLGPTHEEVITPIAKKYIQSYKDLPKYVFQIQDKFRDEPRAKSGLLRGREFLMKDLYSFHTDQKDLARFYEEVKKSYTKIFERAGLKTTIVEASGGTFTKEFTHEFQVLSEVGEDTIFYCDRCDFARNQEIFKGAKNCPKCKTGKLEKAQGIEVGNIFKLGTKFSEDFGLYFTDKKGEKHPVWMGSYGIGLGRFVGAVADVFKDEKGLVWPPQVAPFGVYLMEVKTVPTTPMAGRGDRDPDRSVGKKGKSEETYRKLQKEGIEVLWDDREEATAGERFNDADLLGIPWRAVISEKTEGKVELKSRKEEKSTLVGAEELIKKLKNA